MKNVLKTVVCILVAGTALTACKSVQTIYGVPGTPVDLGLSVQWADRNYGAWTEKGEGIGLTWSDTITDKRDRQIAHPWGREWKTPTGEQIIELMDKCMWHWQEETPQGYIVTGPNGNSIFMPMVEYGYWTLAIDKQHKPFVSYMYFNPSYPAMSYGEQESVRHVRPVYVKRRKK